MTKQNGSENNILKKIFDMAVKETKDCFPGKHD